MAYRTLQLEKYDPQTIFSNAEIGQNCWIWQGSMYENGYGKYGKRGFMAHRLAYELAIGDVPSDMCLDHLCRNRACINPAHLEIVTMSENLRRGESFSGKNARKTHCIHGHNFTNANTYIHPKRGSRLCRQCRDINADRYKLKRILTNLKEG
jgi:hypothetical protein